MQRRRLGLRLRTFIQGFHVVGVFRCEAAGQTVGFGEERVSLGIATLRRPHGALQPQGARPR